MKEVELEDWGIIRNGEKQNYLTHLLFESENGKYAFYFSEIVEWSLMKYCTKLEIFENKISPEKIFDNNSPWFLYDQYIPEFIYDWSDYGFLCLSQLLQPEPNVWRYPRILIDLRNRKIATLSYPHALLKLFNNQIEISWDKIRFPEKENIFIHLEELSWNDFNELKDTSWGAHEK